MRQQLIMENWRNFINEGDEPEGLLAKVKKALRDEGGAAGMKALKKHTEASAEEIKKVVDSAEDIKVHTDGDYILVDDSLNEDEITEKKKKKKKKKAKKKDACYHKVKARYDVWPSAYASGALVKCRKVGAKNWGKSSSKKESLELQEMIQEELQAVLDENGSESLHQWFKGGGWVQAVSGKPCARQPGQKTTPKCVSRAKRASMSKKERESAQRRKRAADPGQPKKTGAAKPTYVATDKPKKKKSK